MCWICFFHNSAEELKQVHIEYLKIAGNRKKAFLGGRVTLTCSMFNADVPVWRRNGKTIMSNRQVWSRKYFFDRRGIKFYLEISNVTKDDEGLYMCYGHAHGMSDNKTLYLQTGLSKRARKNNKLKMKSIHQGQCIVLVIDLEVYHYSPLLPSG